MKRLKRYAALLVLLFGAILLLRYPEVSAHAVKTGLQVCGSSILPSLFPFFAVTNLWLDLGYGSALSSAAGPAMEKLFHLPRSTAAPLLLGCIGGYPIGAQTIARFHAQKLLSKSDAEQALLFCCNAGPAFIFGILGSGVFHSTAIGGLLWLVHLSSAVLLGFLFRPRKRPADEHRQPERSAPASLLPILTSSITQAGETALRVCVFVLFFSVLTSYLAFLFPPSTADTVWFSLLSAYC